MASDVDGTLLRADGTLSARVREALTALTVPFVLVTGRPQRWIDRLAAEIGTSGAAIALNGALTYDLATGEVVRELELTPDVMRTCAAAIRTVLPDALFGTESLDGFAREVGYPTRYTLDPPEGSSFAAVVGVPALKLLCRSASVDAAGDLYDAALAACRGLPVELTHSTGTVGLLEISAAGVDKAAALAAYAQTIGVRREDVLAFGDGFNDVAMLAWAGRGVAVANAHPAVLDVADEVTASNDDDGVARVLEPLVGEGF